MGTIQVRMHPDKDLDIARPADLLLTDPKGFTVTGVFRLQGEQRKLVKPGDSDYPFENDDSNTSALGDAEPTGSQDDERFQKLTPKLKGEQKDGLAGNEYEIKWEGVPVGRGPHFRVFP